MTSDYTSDSGTEPAGGGAAPFVARGVLLAGRFRVGEAIGRGGMSTVYRGYDELLRRDVAVKVMSAPAAGTTGSRQEFLDEARAAAALLHPNIAGIYDVGIQGSERFIIMEFVPGGSLLDLIDAEAPLTPSRAVQLATEIAGALEYGHRHGIIHCDVKPQNVLLDETGRAKLVDFGISRAIAATGALTDTIRGTAGYIAPEQLQGERLDGRADIYSLGCVVYEMLTDALPFESSNLTVLATQRLTRPPTPLRQKNPQVPPALAQSVMRALERDPDQRYRTASDFSEALSAGLTLADPVRRAPARASTGEFTRRPTAASTVLRERTDGRRGSGRLVLLTLALLIIVLAAAAGAWAIGLPQLLQGSAATAVPNVTGMTLGDAVQQLHSQRLGVQLSFSDTTNPTSCNGSLLREDPPPGTRVGSGSVVTLTVSRNAQC